MGISKFDYDAMQARLAANQIRREVVMSSGVIAHDAVDYEADLHDQIISYCQRNGWVIVHSRMDMRTTVGVGTPDFVLGAPGGKTF